MPFQALEKTTWVVETAKASKTLGGKVAAITRDRESGLAKVADVLVQIKSEAISREVIGYTTRELIGIPMPPLGSLFEISTLIFFEACVLELMPHFGIYEDDNEKDPCKPLDQWGFRMVS